MCGFCKEKSTTKTSGSSKHRSAPPKPASNSTASRRSSETGGAISATEAGSASKQRDPGEHARELRAQASEGEQTAELAASARERAQAEIRVLENGAESPSRWEREHPDAREQLKHAANALDIELDRHAQAAIADPGEHLTRLLGERPPIDQAPERDTWDRGARAVERYRAEYNIEPSELTPLGPQPERRHSSGPQRLAWRAAAQQAGIARAQLGPARRGLGPLEPSLARLIELTTPDRDRDHGFDR